MSSPRQLEMVRPHLDDLPPLEVPPGCALRTYLPGDENHWARIMNDSIGSGWDGTRCLRDLVNRVQFHADGCFFATVDGVPEGTATAYVLEAFQPDAGYVHMVGVAPAQRGRGLGLLVTLATLHWFERRGFRQALLRTDDWRLPAIGVYLRLGFEPVLFDDSHAARWAEVRRQLRPPAGAVP